MSGVSKVRPRDHLSRLPTPLVHQIGGYLDNIKDLIVVFARASKQLQNNLLKNNLSSVLIRQVACNEYPLLAEDLSFLLEREYPNRDDRTGINIAKLFRKIDFHMKYSLFLPSHIDVLPYDRFHPQRIAFHKSMMYVYRLENGVQGIDAFDIRTMKKRFRIQDSFLEFPECRGSGAIAANDEYVAVNRITVEPSPLADCSGSSTINLYDCRTGNLLLEISCEDAISTICFDQRGNLAVGDNRGGIIIIKLMKNKPSKAKEEGAKAPISTLSYEKEVLSVPFQTSNLWGGREGLITALHATSENLYCGGRWGSVAIHNLATKRLLGHRYYDGDIAKFVVRSSEAFLVLHDRNRSLSITSGAITRKIEIQSWTYVGTPDKSFCLSDKWMFLAKELCLRRFKPFNFKKEISDQQEVRLKDTSNNDVTLLHCDGARLAFHFTADKFHPNWGSQVRIFDFSLDPEKVSQKLETQARVKPDSVTIENYLEHFTRSWKNAKLDLLKKKDSSADHKGA